MLKQFIFNHNDWNCGNHDPFFEILVKEFTDNFIQE